MNRRAQFSKTDWKFLGGGIIGLVSLLLFFVPQSTHSQSAYLTEWTIFYEGFTTLGGEYGCGVCHVPGSTNYSLLNPYGTDIQPCVAAGGLVDECILFAEEIDSDGDGCLNVDEIYFSSHPGIANPGTCAPVCDDTDMDQICDDGDASGVVGDNPCLGGETQNCDDNCLFIYNPLQEDCDSDGIGNPCDIDDDGDGYDVVSPSPLWDCNDSCADVNLDGVPDGFPINPGAKEICGNAIDENCDTLVEPLNADLDGDSVAECLDNCPGLYNPLQTDMDQDGFGDECDSDLDGDGLPNTVDPAPMIVPNGDVNRDGRVDVADAMLAERIASGAWVPTDPVAGHMADVEPYLSGGSADNVVTVRDVLKIIRIGVAGP